METKVPFQFAYAVFIYKAQGLEYNSVKIVITKEVDEMMKHHTMQRFFRHGQD